MIHLLENSIMAYSWGSPDGIPDILGLPNPGGGPLAELWMGAHPKAPSLAILPEGKKPLDVLIRSEPEATLGLDCVSRFGAQLPFLFKILSAARPLSIQVHPEKRKAERGYDKEERASVPIDSPDRAYRDRNHKPELAVALTPFEALLGFRSIEEIIALTKDLLPPEQRKFIDRLGKYPERIELSVFFYSLMSQAVEHRKALLDQVTARIDAKLGAGQGDEVEAPAWKAVLRLAKLWPGDIGALGPLLFNLLSLEPGEAVFIGPGQPHAYLGGTAVEIMANSDNVIRAGLTEKRVDIPEFMSVLSFDLRQDHRVLPVVQGDGELLYPCPVRDFALSIIDARGRGSRILVGPEIILCGGGRVELTAGSSRLVLERGQSAFIGASARSWSWEGEGRLWRARTEAAGPADRENSPA